MPDYIVGKRPILEALRTHIPLQKILIADNLKRDGLVNDVLRKAARAEVSVETVRRADLDKKTERANHQGMVALAKPFAYVSMQAILDGEIDDMLMSYLRWAKTGKTAQ